ncbi:hypothetical protein C8Q76DRAFT_227665 [Earliella scabrosa]|nr:hypothetical protein C8Q76DRAFT_227665 [Earliella scabrosa]
MSSQPHFAPASEPLPPYDYPKPPRMNPSASFTSTISSLPIDKETPFTSYRGLESTPSLAAGSSTPSSPTPIYDHFSRRRTFDGPVSVSLTDSIPPLPPFPASPTFPSSVSPSHSRSRSLSHSQSHSSSQSTPSSPISPLSPTEPAHSPTDSMFSHESDQSAVSLSFTDIEAAYGARVPSFVSLEVEQSSAPPTPFNLHHVTS